MPAKWADALAPGSATRQEFEKLLAARIEQDFEPEDELNSCVLQALLEVEDKQSLHAELEEVFEDQAVLISDWCWETLGQLKARQSKPAESDTAASSPPAAASPPDQPSAERQKQQAQHSKRAPIRFNLDSAAPETAPKKASDEKAQQLGAQKPAALQAPAKQSQAAAPAPAQQPPAKTEQQQQQTKPSTGGSGSGSSRQRGAPAARLLHMTGLIRPADGNTGSSGRESRGRSRQQDQHDQQQQQQARPVERSRSPQHQQQQQQQRKRELEEPDAAQQSRPAPGASRRGPASVLAGTGSVFRNAVDGLKSGSRSETAPQEQEQRGGTSVFARIDKNDLARLGVPQPQQQQAALKQASGNRQSDKQQQQQQGGFVEGLPRSLQGRLGILPDRLPQPTAAAAARPGASAQAERTKPSPAAAAPGASVPAVGDKRKAESAPAAAAAAAAPAPAAAGAPKASVLSSAVAGAPAQQQQQQAQPGAAAKKTRTAAPAAGSKEAQLAALRAQLEARQAEVLRLKQAQEADQVSVAVFGVSPRVPDTVLMAHFRSCAQSCQANIRRCTMLAGRFPPHVMAPSAYVEFEGMGGDPAARAKAAHQATSNALQLSGSMLLDQKITVVRKSDWQANQAKGQRVYTAGRPGAAQPAAAGNRTWTATAPAAAAVTTGGAAAMPSAAGVGGS